MSTLGDEIRSQATVASRLAADVTQSARDLRQRTQEAEWVSPAADRCREILGRHARKIDDAADSAHGLSDTVTAHARAVESHQATIAAFFHSNGSKPETLDRAHLGPR